MNKPKAKNLKNLRRQKNLSVAQLSILSNVSFKTITAYETGQNYINNASAIILYKIAQALGCKIEDLLEGVKI